ncbi:alpha/beta fold hydrolase [Rhodoplanes sp. TEM]|uniref:Alpha/beta fold hydrolase n=1 Tax=Rhodoplanes tepidamans TaxID=200616 RepID=A0ABT5JJL3_RHOTP|nr:MULTISPECIES: alpha/beta fold hydrolase [Rhodoplanes]MDC7789683.1 alpha/beta fold hydrolase [Rhodoplanes tepidamans]MDC7987912.1 alpha/beta fold hydrolase [Rhodoplanes sp. TEM]MDQ0359201.1 pimeloyl-ACP methyl ester carboxylesterase [Rhodoplanes tepidamans]
MTPSVDSLLLGAAAAAAVVLGLGWLAHRVLLLGLKAPRVPHDCGPHDLGLPAASVRELSIAGMRGKRLFAWLVTPDVATAAPHPAVLVMHGWGSNAAMMLPVVAPLREAGFSVLLLDARCHGRSDDEDFASMPRFAEDIAAGLGVLRAQPGVDPGRIGLIGHSVGAAATLLHASRDPAVRAVVSISAFAHPGELMRAWLSRARIPYPVIGWAILRHVERTIGARFAAIAPLATVRRVGCPVLLVHGRHDATVPFSDAERLAAAAPHATLLAVDGDHDLRDALAPFTDELVAFLIAATRAPALADA